MIKVEKLDGSLVPFDENRIVIAVNKSAVKTGHPVTDNQMSEVLSEVHSLVHMADINESILTVDDLHATVSRALSKVRFDVASEYSQFRRHKREQNKEVELSNEDDNQIDMHQLKVAKKAIDKIILKHPKEHVYSILHRYMGDVEQNADKDLWKFIANPIVMQLLIRHITNSILNK